MNILNFLPIGRGTDKGSGEWAGSCPHGYGEDRFVVWPEHSPSATGGRYFCRGGSYSQCRNCSKTGDGIQFLREFRGMTFSDACKELHHVPTEPRDISQIQQKTWKPKLSREPSPLWRKRAVSFLAECASHLEYPPCLTYLQERGLALDFAKEYQIGWNPSDRYDNPELWGVEQSMNKNGNPSKIFLPAGLVLPVRRKRWPQYIKIRRAEWNINDKLPKYWAVRGGGTGCLRLLCKNYHLPVVIVESEIDAFLVAQEASSLCWVVALGSAANRPDLETSAWIKESQYILVSLDFDDAGKNNSLWWKSQFPNSLIWPPATGKDIGEMMKARVSIAAWIQEGVRQAQYKPPITPPVSALPSQLRGKVC